LSPDALEFNACCYVPVCTVVLLTASNRGEVKRRGRHSMSEMIRDRIYLAQDDKSDKQQSNVDDIKVVHGSGARF
jgi:hypothetical protein